jgi:hypothetical protein
LYPLNPPEALSCLAYEVTIFKVKENRPTMYLKMQAMRYGKVALQLYVRVIVKDPNPNPKNPGS